MRTKKSYLPLKSCEACGDLLVSATSSRWGVRPGEGVRLGGGLGPCCGPQQAWFPETLSLVPHYFSPLLSRRAFPGHTGWVDLLGEAPPFPGAMV